MAKLSQKEREKKKEQVVASFAVKLDKVYICCLVAFLVIIGAMVYINLKHGKEYERIVVSQENIHNTTTIPFKRGDILDANGALLATSIKTYNVVLDSYSLSLNPENITTTSEALMSQLNIPSDEMQRYLAENSRYVVVKKGLSEEEKVKAEEYFATKDKFSNVTFEIVYKRVYPNGNLACHMLGYTSSGNKGQAGIEAQYNEVLNGVNGVNYEYVNDYTNIMDSVDPVQNGCNLVTSIDVNIQTIVQNTVEDYMENGTGAKNVSVLVMNPNNSNILAMYNSHQFDLNDAYNLEQIRYQFENKKDYQYDGEHYLSDYAYLENYEDFDDFEENAAQEEQSAALFNLWRNFVVSDVYEPGSTYKIFTISGALEEGVVNADDEFYCDGGEQVVDYYIRCTAHSYGGHGMQDLSKALSNSCNDALMAIGAKEGPAIFDKYQTLFGFGQRSNIDIPGEPSSAELSTLIYHRATLNPVELATSSFGQGVTASMIELGTAFCSVINGGYYYEPSIVQRVEDENGNIVSTQDSVLVRKTISEEVSAEMREMLFKVVDEGTGKRASVEGYEIGGKTGTAEKIPRDHGLYLISFIGFAPIDQPKVMIYVIVDQPHLDNQSSSPEASYLFADIAEQLFPYLGIYKTGENYDLDLENAEDEPMSPIYEGDVPENDVAGGADNPYVPSGE